MKLEIGMITLDNGIESDGIVYIERHNIRHILRSMDLTPTYGLLEVDDCDVLICYTFYEATTQYVVLVSDGKVESWRLQPDGTWRKEQ